MPWFLTFYCISFFCNEKEILRKLYITNVAIIIAACVNLFLKCEMIYWILNKSAYLYRTYGSKRPFTATWSFWLNCMQWLSMFKNNKGREDTCIEKQINYLSSIWTKREGEETKSGESFLISKLPNYWLDCNYKCHSLALMNVNLRFEMNVNIMVWNYSRQRLKYINFCFKKQGQKSKHTLCFFAKHLLQQHPALTDVSERISRSSNTIPTLFPSWLKSGRISVLVLKPWGKALFPFHQCLGNSGLPGERLKIVFVLNTQVKKI